MCFVFPSTGSVSAQIMWSICRWHENALEVVSESLKLKNFPGGRGGEEGVPTDPPGSWCTQHTVPIHHPPKVTYV